MLLLLLSLCVPPDLPVVHELQRPGRAGPEHDVLQRLEDVLHGRPLLAVRLGAVHAKEVQDVGPRLGWEGRVQPALRCKGYSITVGGALHILRQIQRKKCVLTSCQVSKK